MENSQDKMNITHIIKQTRSIVIERARTSAEDLDLKSKIEWQNRRQFLDDLSQQFQEMKQGALPQRRVFISYSYSSGILYFEYLKMQLEKAGFEVVTGFDPAEGDKGGVLTRVLGQIRRSTLYLAILTKDMKVSTQGGDRWAPGVWIVEEKGMALALGKPFVLMVEEGIHDDYWSKTTAEIVHEKFNQQNFYDKVVDTIDELKKRYHEFEIEYMDRGVPTKRATSEVDESVTPT